MTYYSPHANQNLKQSVTTLLQRAKHRIEFFPNPQKKSPKSQNPKKSLYFTFPNPPLIILLMRNTEVNRSQQYSYFLNKSIHYNNIKNVKPVVADKQSPKTYRYSVDSDGFAMNRKYRKSIERTRDLENEQMMSRILRILQSPRTEVGVQGYSKFNEVKRNFMNIKKDEIERERNIELFNKDLVDRITNTRPMVGSLEKWNQHYQRYRSQARNASRFKDDNSRKSRLEIHGPHLPRQISSILDEQQLKSLKSDKKLSLEYDRLFVLPSLGPRKKAETSWLHQKSQTIDVHAKDDLLLEQASAKTIDHSNPQPSASPAQKEQTANP